MGLGRDDVDERGLAARTAAMPVGSRPQLARLLDAPRATEAPGQPA